MELSLHLLASLPVVSASAAASSLRAKRRHPSPPGEPVLNDRCAWKWGVLIGCAWVPCSSLQCGVQLTGQTQGLGGFGSRPPKRKGDVMSTEGRTVGSQKPRAVTTSSNFRMFQLLPISSCYKRKTLSIFYISIFFPLRVPAVKFPSRKLLIHALNCSRQFTSVSVPARRARNAHPVLGLGGWKWYCVVSIGSS